MIKRSPDHSRAILLSLLLIVSAGLIAYANSFSGPFIYDDVPSIPENPHIRALWPIGQAMAAPHQSSLDGRPIAALSFALNCALGGMHVWSYHAFNFLLHLLAGFTLLGIVRQTLAGPRLNRVYGEATPWLALAVALIWIIHPLATEAVNYIVQRTELLMGLFFLLTLYCAIRGTEPASSRRWNSAAVIACALGMGSKEVMASAPLIVLLYDRTFLFGSFREAFRKRGKLYLALAGTWLILIALMAPGPRSESVGLRFSQLTPWQYLFTQSSVILHYLRLAFWPHPLVLDYHDWPIPQSVVSAAPWTAIVLALLALTVWLLRRNFPLGFLGAWFFLILAPTSSFVPIVTEIAAERRMYLPLAAIVASVVGGGWILLRRTPMPEKTRRWVAIGLAAGLAVGFGWMTIRRNADYRSEITIWSDAVAKRPGNARAHNNFGLALVTAGRVEEGMAHYRQALRLSPDYGDAYINLGAASAALGRYDQAIENYVAALKINPNDARAHTNLGNTLFSQGRMEEAIAHHLEALRLKPDSPEVRNNFGAALMEQGRLDEAVTHYTEALRLRPEFPEAHSNLGIICTSQGKFDEAISHFREALRLKPGNPKTLNNYGNTLIHLGRFQEAAEHLTESIRLKPDYAEAHNNLGVALGELGRLDEAVSHYHEALRLKPDSIEIRRNLDLIKTRQAKR